MDVKKTASQGFLYLIVGGLATVVEWGMFYVLNQCISVHYMAATPLAFVFSTFANWAFGRLILFHTTNQSTAKELIKIYIVSIIGLLLNIAIMFVSIEKLGLKEMPSKIFATALVFIWNFLIRKLVIYKV